MNIDEFCYEDYGNFSMLLDDGDIGKWRDLVRGLEIPDVFPLSFLLNGLAQDNITFEGARLMLEPHRPSDRKGDMTQIVDLLDALNHLVLWNDFVRAPVTLWVVDGTRVFVYTHP